VDTARRVVADILAYGTVRRGWIDIEPVPLFDALAKKAGLPVTRGILVSRVARGSAAEAAGLRGGDPSATLTTGGRKVFLGGDVIVGIEGLPVWTIMDLLGALESTHPGDTVRVEVQRGERRLIIPVVLSARPSAVQW
jgi:S1-C subfamily serine protease